jgi:hypothetical protein
MVGHIGTQRQERCGLGHRAHSTIWRHGYRGDKTVTLAIPRLDEALRLPIVADGVAYGLQTVFNRGIADSLSRPYLFTELLLRNHTVAVRQERGKRLEHFWSQWNRLVSPA